MSTYTRLIYHIVFATKHCEHTLEKENRERLFRYIAGLLRNKSCQLYRINGMEDHLHIVAHIHPSIAIADLVKDIKLASTFLIKSDKLFPKFDGWQAGYAAFTCSLEDKDKLMAYVQNQELIHRKKTFRREYLTMLQSYKIDFDEKYLF